MGYFNSEEVELTIIFNKQQLAILNWLILHKLVRFHK